MEIQEACEDALQSHEAGMFTGIVPNSPEAGALIGLVGVGALRIRDQFEQDGLTAPARQIERAVLPGWRDVDDAAP